MSAYKTIEWRAGVVRLLDQRSLPHELRYLEYSEPRTLAAAIREMVIRGAPALGAAAGYGLALAAYHSQAPGRVQLEAELEEAAALLRAARPTAVNLFHSVERVLSVVSAAESDQVAELRRIVLDEAAAIVVEDVYTNKQIGLNAFNLLPQTVGRPIFFMHHCNTGALAATDYGTALGIIRTAHEHGREVFVYVDETRPRLQGARLTSWELRELGIPHAVIVDGSSGHIMRTKIVDLVVVGCDRVSANGDTANKIGTYNLALAAQAHGIPFYVAAPTSTLDLSLLNGEQIPIEERPAEEIAQIGLERILPDGVNVFNPAFDITPARYISAIITEAGIAFPPYEASLAIMVSKARK